jgi:hypothetical protein
MPSTPVDRLWDPSPMALETGYERLADGSLHVACRTDLHRCNGEKFEWWFRSQPGTREYVWWHPVDHVSSEWLDCSKGTHVGSIHTVEEYFTGRPFAQLVIQFRDPHGFFDPSKYDEAKRTKQTSSAVCARGGRSWNAPGDQADRMLGSRLFHVTRDTNWGCVVRSHFLLGHDLPLQGLAPEEVSSRVLVDAAEALLVH